MSKYLLIRYVDHFGIPSTKSLTPKTGCFEHSGVHELCCFDHFWNHFTHILDILRPQKKNIHFSTIPRETRAPYLRVRHRPRGRRGQGLRWWRWWWWFCGQRIDGQVTRLAWGEIFCHRKNDDFFFHGFLVKVQKCSYRLIPQIFGHPSFLAWFMPGTLKPSIFFNGFFSWVDDEPNISI